MTACNVNAVNCIILERKIIKWFIQYSLNDWKSHLISYISNTHFTLAELYDVGTMLLDKKVQLHCIYMQIAHLASFMLLVVTVVAVFGGGSDGHHCCIVILDN